HTAVEEGCLPSGKGTVRAWPGWISEPRTRGGSAVSIPSHGNVTCQDPQGSVPVRVAHGNVDQFSVSWTLTQCNLKTGVFRIFVQPGNYHVSFTGYPLTLPSNAEVAPTAPDC